MAVIKAPGKPKPRIRAKASGNPRPRGNPNIVDVGFKKGDGRSGRPLGVPNKISRTLRDALIYVAEHSKWSKDGTLESYCTTLADKFPKAYGPLLARLLPLTIDARHQIVEKVVYRTVEEIKASMVARGLPQKTVDLLASVVTNGWTPTPINDVEPDRGRGHDFDSTGTRLVTGNDDGDGAADDVDPQWASAVASRRS
jgi:hypothetical protein